MNSKGTDRPEVVAAVKDKLVPPVGFMGRRFYPQIPSRDVTGEIYHKLLTPDSAAQTRDNEYANIDRVALIEGVKDYKCKEIVKAYHIPESREKAYGGIDATDRIGITAACRSLLRAEEQKAAKLVLSSDRYNAGDVLKDGLVLMGLQVAANSIHRYFGKTILAGSRKFFQNFVLAKDISKKLSGILGNSFSSQNYIDSLAGEPNIAIAMLRAFLPFDEILVGDDEFWALPGMEDAGFVARLPPADWKKDPEMAEMIMREEPVFGVCPWYFPDPGDPTIEFSARSWFDNNNHTYVYDSVGWFQQLELNPEAVKIVKFTAEAVATTTTTTTTTLP